ncbi:MAG TPA: hydantoinase B/oxoprolinase family protein [Hyphomicrobiaceae bacterium]|nr:hydantoinase B/oxoprolinase family protein [Hyphomicrobiaceae bacterium]
MASANQRFDAVTLEIFWRRMISAVDEAAKALRRTSFSTLVNESNDFALVLTDAHGQSLAQNTESIPSFIGTLPVTVKEFIRQIGVENIRPGDVLITNTPWIATGHLNDITVAKPIFRKGRLAAFAASTAHAPDIGGRVRSAEAREVFEEGFHIPVMKLMSEGVLDTTLVKLLRAQVRTPDQTEGDLWAQLTGLDLLEGRLGDLMDEYALDGLEAFSEEILSRSERAMRAAIRALPDGVYPYEFKTDGLDEPFTYRISVAIRGDKVVADYEGTSPQVDRAINCPITYTYAMTAYAFKCALLPNLPNNEGIFRCIEVKAPEGSLVNPRYPAAVGGRMATGHYLPIAVFGALQAVLGEAVIAASGSPLWSLIQTGVRPNGKTYANVLFFNGGMGATGAGDGQSTYAWPSNVSNVPVELIERNAPLLINRKALRPDSGGPGRHRGGLGQEIAFEVLSETPVGMIFMAERCRFPAEGAMGGANGAPGDLTIDGRSVDHRRNVVLTKGQQVVLRTPGGGGFGAPEEREAGAIEDDRRLGYVSAVG